MTTLRLTGGVERHVGWGRRQFAPVRTAPTRSGRWQQGDATVADRTQVDSLTRKPPARWTLPLHDEPAGASGNGEVSRPPTIRSTLSDLTKRPEQQPDVTWWLTTRP
jgi:hypothetical protein